MVLSLASVDRIVDRYGSRGGVEEALLWRAGCWRVARSTYLRLKEWHGEEEEVPLEV